MALLKFRKAKRQVLFSFALHSDDGNARPSILNYHIVFVIIGFRDKADAGLLFEAFNSFEEKLLRCIPQVASKHVRNLKSRMVHRKNTEHRFSDWYPRKSAQFSLG